MNDEEVQRVADEARAFILREHANGGHRYSFQPECPACQAGVE